MAIKCTQGGGNGGFMRVSFEVFRGMWSSWNELFERASSFATSLGPSRVLSVSHSDDGSDGVVTVWYCDAEGAGEGAWRGEPDSAPALAYEVFRGAWISWEELFHQAADYASGIQADRLLGISHSCDRTDGVVTIWYWE
jgi:hypothetical protein